jgi:hypothetical protein
MLLNIGSSPPGGRVRPPISIIWTSAKLVAAPPCCQGASTYQLITCPRQR